MKFLKNQQHILFKVSLSDIRGETLQRIHGHASLWINESTGIRTERRQAYICTNINFSHTLCMTSFSRVIKWKEALNFCLVHTLSIHTFGPVLPRLLQVLLSVLCGFGVLEILELDFSFRRVENQSFFFFYNMWRDIRYNNLPILLLRFNS